MSDHDETYARFCGPRFDGLDRSVSSLVSDVNARMDAVSNDVHGRIDDMDEKRIRPMEVKLSNGFDSRIKNVETMQWWQLGLTVAIVGLIITLHIIEGVG